MRDLVLNIESKVKKLIILYNEINKEKEDILIQNNKLKLEISEKNLDLKKLEEKIKLFRITKSVDDQDDGNNKASRKKINEYVREIDKCIALLNE